MLNQRIQVEQNKTKFNFKWLLIYTGCPMKKVRPLKLELFFVIFSRSTYSHKILLVLAIPNCGLTIFVLSKSSEILRISFRNQFCEKNNYRFWTKFWMHKKGRPHFGNAKAMTISWLLTLEFILLKLVYTNKCRKLFQNSKTTFNIYFKNCILSKSRWNYFAILKSLMFPRNYSL